MLGNTVFRYLSTSFDFIVYGTSRSPSVLSYFDSRFHEKIITGIDVENYDSLTHALATAKPDLVINCIGLVKQLDIVDNPIYAIPINSLLPHRLSELSRLIGARFVHISTDCVFSGKKGNYTEHDVPDALDLYGKSKYLGEVDNSHSITLRTSIIGHELSGSQSLISWFLKQQGTISGYSRAIFSGFPTVEISRIIRDFIIPDPSLNGLFHLSADPISKYDLLTLVANVYKKTISIDKCDRLVIDRSLNSRKFRDRTGFQPRNWISMIEDMHNFG